MGQRLVKHIGIRRRNSDPYDIHDFGEELTIQESEELKHIWEICRESNIGERIIFELVREQPEFRRFFGLDSNNLSVRTTIPLQGDRIDRFLDTVFLALTSGLKSESEQLLREQCHRVGSIHFCRRVNLVDEGWAHFERVAVNTLMEEHQRQCGSERDQAHLEEQWKTLFAKITTEIKSGYETEQQFMNAFTPRPVHKKSQTVEVMRRCPSVPVSINYGEIGITILNPIELEAARNVWENVSIRKEVGMTLLIRMINEKPSYGKYLGIDPSKKMTELWDDTSVRVQGHRIQLFFETVVNLYDSQTLDKLKQMCRAVGAVHFKKSVNFTADIWLVFKRDMIEIVNDSTVEGRSSKMRRNNELALGAWDKLMRWIIKEMKQGFLREAQSSGTNLNEQIFV